MIAEWRTGRPNTSKVHTEKNRAYFECLSINNHTLLYETHVNPDRSKRCRLIILVDAVSRHGREISMVIATIKYYEHNHDF